MLANERGRLLPSRFSLSEPADQLWSLSLFDCAISMLQPQADVLVLLLSSNFYRFLGISTVKSLP